MTPEEIQRAIEFLLDHDAKFAVKMDQIEDANLMPSTTRQTRRGCHRSDRVWSAEQRKPRSRPTPG